VILIERSTRYVMLGHLAGGHTAEEVRHVLVPLIQTLPGHLRGSLTWDQGCEMAAHKQFTVATGVPVYFCDSHSPWQRGSNENTNGLLRLTFPRAPTCPCTAPKTSNTSPSNSGADHAKRSAGEPQPSACVIYGGGCGSGKVVTCEDADSVSEVAGNDGEREPGGIGREAVRGQVGRTGGFQLGYGLLDHRMPPMVGLRLQHVAFAVGDERMVVVAGEQGQLQAGSGANPADDQPDRQSALGMREAGEGGLGDICAGDSGVDNQYGIGFQASCAKSFLTETAGRVRHDGAVGPLRQDLKIKAAIAAITELGNVCPVDGRR